MRTESPVLQGRSWIYNTKVVFTTNDLCCFGLLTLSKKSKDHKNINNNVIEVIRLTPVDVWIVSKASKEMKLFLNLTVKCINSVIQHRWRSQVFKFYSINFDLNSTMTIM